MKTGALFLLLSAASLAVMTLVDLVIGPKAEFLNAWSVVERLLGRPPSAGDSVVFAKLGAFGEAVTVVLVNAGIGGVLTWLVRWFQAR